MKPEAFLAIERTMAATLNVAIDRIGRGLLVELEPLLIAGKWGEAHAAIDRMSLAGVVAANKGRLEELAVSALLFGAHHHTGDPKTTVFANKALPPEIQVALDQLTEGVEADGADTLRKQLHSFVRSHELLDPRTPLMKANDQHYPAGPKGGQFAPKLHPHTDDHGQPVKIYKPSKSLNFEHMNDPRASVTFLPGKPVDKPLNYVPLWPWTDAPTTTEGWANVEGQIPLDLPPVKRERGITEGAGVIIQEPDGRIWLTAPTNGFGGYRATFPKGTVEHGLSSQASAIKEAYEETGLKVEITGVLGDFEKTTSNARFYLARRVGGTPQDMGWESQACHLVTMDEALHFLHRIVDKTIFAAIKQRVAKYDEDQPRDDHGRWTANLKTWFGESKVVDAKGQPLVVYHGSPDMRFMADDATFKSPSERFGTSGANDGAFWFASSRGTAASYADDTRAFDYQAAEPGIIPAYLRMLNPLIVDAAGKEWREAQQRGKTSDVIDAARKGGHDGVIIRNVRDNYNNDKKTKPTDTYVVFSSKQIKSTKNTGAFDPHEANITKDDISEDELAQTGGLQEPEQGGARKKKVRKGDRTLYVNRPLLNTEDITRWMITQGFTNALPDDEMHVTICYSKEPFAWPEDTAPWQVKIADDTTRTIEQFGDATVLHFASPDLLNEHNWFRANGASYDFPVYKAHVTLTYDLGDLDIANVTPYAGPLVFGEQEWAEITPGWADGLEEQRIRKGFDPNQPRDKEGQWTDDGSKPKLGPQITTTMQRIADARGFDTSKVWYHGSRAKFAAFQPVKEGKGVEELGSGTYLTDDPFYANTWAKEGGSVYKCYLRRGEVFDHSKPPTDDVFKRMHAGHSKFMDDMFGPNSADPTLDAFKDRLKTAGYDNTISGRRLSPKFLKFGGYVGAVDPKSQIPGQVVVFDPADVFIAARAPGGDTAGMKEADKTLAPDKPAKKIKARSVQKAADNAMADALNAAFMTGAKMPVDIGAHMTTARLAKLGFLAEAVDKDITLYQITEVLDTKTCPVCRYMHGKILKVAPEYERTLQALKTGDPAALKSINPWPDQSKAGMKKLYGMTLDEMQQAGHGAPPFHPFCRGILVPVGHVKDEIHPLGSLKEPEPHALANMSTMEMLAALGAGDIDAAAVDAALKPALTADEELATVEAATPFAAGAAIPKPGAADMVSVGDVIEPDIQAKIAAVADVSLQQRAMQAYIADDMEELHDILVDAGVITDADELQKAEAQDEEDDDFRPNTDKKGKRKAAQIGGGQAQDYQDLQPDSSNVAFDNGEPSGPLDRD